MKRLLREGLLLVLALCVAAEVTAQGAKSSSGHH